MIIAQQPAEMAIASYLTDPSKGGNRLMEIILERENMARALKQVRANKGAPGVDGMTVDQLPSYLRRHWQKVKASLLDGSYIPFPVRRKEIPKPQGGFRKLGIPAVLDRLLQQAISQVLQLIWEPVFSDSSYGFRPGRCQHQAVQRVKQYVEEGFRHVVDMDLSKFFDRVNHDRVMSRLATKIPDKRLLKLIRKFLTSGVMIGGLVEPQNEGTPQGGLCKALHNPPYAKLTIMQSKSLSHQISVTFAEFTLHNIATTSDLKASQAMQHPSFSSFFCIRNVSFSDF